MSQTGAQPKLYLLDVEGTTSPISLVSEQLFPYARKHLAAYLRAHDNDAAVAADLELLGQENSSETDDSRPAITGGSLEDAIAYLLWLMDRDRKSTALKSLQGKIWKAGFEAGELVGTVFPDVPEAMMRWSSHGKVSIYSSGSVEAQKLLFRYSSVGDLTPLISANFDTRIGPKIAAASYKTIASAMGIELSGILFFSDVVRELDAAREAGCATRLVIREGNAWVADANGHTSVRSFAELS
ncbi:acireductone synthase [Acidicapsa dinghuensis]|uniref:Enolase-phosphatase E1 n=1 Tax=Acidicapsa dinghuensis TaxID=2218256 RepID=A0ABW1EJJ5_9BACT|nr:acireductone synthase [Acidicapsa dinghuensis]